MIERMLIFGFKSQLFRLVGHQIWRELILHKNNTYEKQNILVYCFFADLVLCLTFHI